MFDYNLSQAYLMVCIAQEATSREFGWQRAEEKSPPVAWPSRPYRLRDIFMVVIPHLIRTRL